MYYMNDIMHFRMSETISWIAIAVGVIEDRCNQRSELLVIPWVSP